MFLCAGINFIYYKLNNDTLHLFYLTVHGELKTWAVVGASVCCIREYFKMIKSKPSI